MSSAILAVVAVLAATPPAPARWVEDRAGFLTPATRAVLDSRLEAYERATGHQIVVWIDHTLSGEPLDDWAVRTFAAWRIGRKGIDDGLAMFIFADDRKIDIEVGYGLEGQVPDAVASRIIRDVMAPRLRAGDRDGAVTAGVEAVISTLEGRVWTPPPGTTGKTRPSSGEYVFGGLIALFAVILFIINPRAALWFVWWMIASRWGGGEGPGGGGGFRGGGGRSGGGGARGGW